MTKRFGRLTICVVFGAILGWHSIRSQAAEATADSERIVVMISVDGLAAFYLKDPQAEMPTIRKLAAQGASAESMRVSTPSVTWPNHTTLVTGVNPAKHGVVGNNYFDRQTGEWVVLVSDPVYAKEQIVKVPTLYDLAKAQGLKTAAVRWPATRDARSLDWTVPDMRADSNLLSHVTPALLKECTRAGIQLVPKEPGAAVDDDVATAAFNQILRQHRPNVALLHVSSVDHMQHLYGPRTPEAYAAIKASDGQVRAVWEELERDFPGKATLFVVSDHGFSLIQRSVLPNVVLRQAGVKVASKTNPKAEVAVVVQGGSALIYILEKSRREELVEKAKAAFSGLEGVESVIGPEGLGAYGVADPGQDPHAPDMIVFAKDGFAFGNTASGEQPYRDKFENKGSHGHDPHLANLHATFVAWGMGIKPGTKLGEISNTSVAPTLGRLLNLTFPDADGPVLSAVLAN